MAYSCLQTFYQTKKHFTHREIVGAKKAIFLQQQVGCPSYTTYKYIVSNNLIGNSSITVDDIERVVYIYGTPMSVFKGKIIIVTPNQSPIPCISIPPPIFQHQQNIEPHVD